MDQPSTSARLKVVWFICPLCKERFPSKTLFISHQIKEHSAELKNSIKKSTIINQSSGQNTEAIFLRGESGQTVQLKVLKKSPKTRIENPKSKETETVNQKNQLVNKTKKENNNNDDKVEIIDEKPRLIREKKQQDDNNTDSKDNQSEATTTPVEDNKTQRKKYCVVRFNEKLPPSVTKMHKIIELSGIPHMVPYFPQLSSKEEAKRILPQRTTPPKNVYYRVGECSEKIVESSVIPHSKPSTNKQINNNYYSNSRKSEEQQSSPIETESKVEIQMTTTTTTYNRPSSNRNIQNLNEKDEELPDVLPEIRSEQYLYCSNCLENFKSQATLDCHLLSCSWGNSNLVDENDEEDDDFNFAFDNKEQEEYRASNNVQNNNHKRSNQSDIYNNNDDVPSKKVRKEPGEVSPPPPPKFPIIQRKKTITKKFKLPIEQEQNFKKPTVIVVNAPKKEEDSAVPKMVKGSDGKFYFVIKGKIQNNNNNNKNIAPSSPSLPSTTNINTNNNNNNYKTTTTSSTNTNSLPPPSRRIAFRCVTCSCIFVSLSDLQAHKVIHSAAGVTNVANGN